jgi:hypothetical protein
MDPTQRESAPVAGISFVIVQYRATYAPLLVRRINYKRKVGPEAAHRTYQTAYAPRDFPSPIFVGSEDAP